MKDPHWKLPATDSILWKRIRLGSSLHYQTADLKKKKSVFKLRRGHTTPEAWATCRRMRFDQDREKLPWLTNEMGVLRPSSDILDKPSPTMRSASLNMKFCFHQYSPLHWGTWLLQSLAWPINWHSGFTTGPQKWKNFKLILDKGDTVKLICYNVFFDEDKPHLDYPWHHATQK